MTKESEMTTEECPVLAGDDPARYKKMLDILREAGADHAWTTKVPTGNLSAWIVGHHVVLVQHVGSGVDVYCNDSPSAWSDMPDWLASL